MANEKHNRDLTEKLWELNKKERIARRYYVSELYFLLNNYPPFPETTQSLIKKEMGGVKHLWLEQFAEGQTEVKKEYKFWDDVNDKEITLVGKCDEITDEAVIEYKTSDKVHKKAKQWMIYQTRLYCSIFERPLGIIYQPVVQGNRFLLKCIGTVKKDNNWFNQQINKLRQYHLTLQGKSQVSFKNGKSSINI